MMLNLRLFGQKMPSSIKQIAFILVMVSIIYSGSVHAQDVVNELQTRYSFEATYSPIKRLKLSLSPELRFDDEFSLSKYHVETGAAFKLSPVFSIEGQYRFVINPRDTKDTEYLSRYMFGLRYKKKLDRYTLSFRMARSNYADDDTDNSKYLRFRGKLKYNIKKCKISPLVGLEAFRDQNEKEVVKMRYFVGADYKLFKKNYIGIRYKLDYFRDAYYNKHIVAINYKIKF